MIRLITNRNCHKTLVSVFKHNRLFFSKKDNKDDFFNNKDFKQKFQKVQKKNQENLDQNNNNNNNNNKNNEQNHVDKKLKKIFQDPQSKEKDADQNKNQKIEKNKKNKNSNQKQSEDKTYKQEIEKIQNQKIEQHDTNNNKYKKMKKKQNDKDQDESKQQKESKNEDDLDFLKNSLKDFIKSYNDIYQKSNEGKQRKQSKRKILQQNLKKIKDKEKFKNIKDKKKFEKKEQHKDNEKSQQDKNKKNQQKTIFQKFLNKFQLKRSQQVFQSQAKLRNLKIDNISNPFDWYVIHSLVAYSENFKTKKYSIQQKKQQYFQILQNYRKKNIIQQNDYKLILKLIRDKKKVRKNSFINIKNQIKNLQIIRCKLKRILITQNQQKTEKTKNYQILKFILKLLSILIIFLLLTYQIYFKTSYSQNDNVSNQIFFDIKSFMFELQQKVDIKPLIIYVKDRKSSTLKTNDNVLKYQNDLDVLLQESEQFLSQNPSFNKKIVILQNPYEIISKYSQFIFHFFALTILCAFILKYQSTNLRLGNTNQKSTQFVKNLGITFKDVAGMSQVKQEMQEFVEFLKNPEKFQKLGAVMPKGALLSGPPGTGKTFLGKAVAGESGVPFFYVAGSEFVEKFVGVGAQRIRELFKEAKKKSPSIIFIDELDAIARKRDGMSSHDEMQTTLNQLLVEMDGFGTNSDVIVIGSTNLSDQLDQAITRPGRLDRTIEVNLPSIEEREAIFTIYLNKIKLNPSKPKSYYSKRLATLTPGFSGADIKNVVNEAAIIAVRQKKSLVDDNDFEEAVEKVIGGIERKGQSLEENKQTVAIHESGHGVVSWFLEGGDPLLKVTIKPRTKGALGFAQYLPSETNLYTKQELLDKIASILAGRCAEIEFFGKSSTGAYDDFQKAKNIAFEIVTTYGMSEEMKFVPFLLDENGNQYYSEKTHMLIDQAVERIIKEQTQRCLEIVKQKKQYIEKLSQQLLTKQVLIFSDIVEILGDRPFKPKENFRRFLEEVKNNRIDASTIQFKFHQLLNLLIILCFLLLIIQKNEIVIIIFGYFIQAILVIIKKFYCNRI